MSDLLPERLGPFRLDRTLGLSMGHEVVQATVLEVPDNLDLKVGDAVVLKRLLPHLVDDPQARAALEAEALQGHRLSSGHSRHAFGVWYRSRGQAQSPEPIAVLEFRPGQSLQKLASRSRRVRRPMTTLEVSALTAQLVEALEALHRPAVSPGAAHGDVASRNVLVEPDGDVLLVDLGDAVPLEGASSTQSHPDVGPTDGSLEPGIIADRRALSELVSTLWSKQHPERPLPQIIAQSLECYAQGGEADQLDLRDMLDGVSPPSVLKAWQIDLNESPDPELLNASVEGKTVDVDSSRWFAPLTLAIALGLTAYYLNAIAF